MAFPGDQFGVASLPFLPEENDAPFEPLSQEPIQQQPSDTPLIFAVAELPLSPEDEEALVTDSLKKVEQAYDEQQPLLEDWATARRQYENRLSREDMSDDWESDLDIPLTFERAQAIVARIVNPIVQEDQIYVAKPRPEQIDYNTSISQVLEPYMDSVCDSWNVAQFCEDVLVDGVIYPFAVVKVPFVRETRLVRPTVVVGGQLTLGPPEEVVVREGAYPEVCEPEDVWWYPVKSPTVDKTAMIWHRIWMAPHEVKAEIRAGRFRDVYPDLELTQRPSPTAPDNSPEKRTSQGEATHFEILEIYRAYDVEKEESDDEGNLVATRETVEIILTVDRTSKKVLRACYNPFADHTRPFFFWWWERKKGSLIGKSMCERLEDMHRGVSASFNQRLEMGALCNANAWATDDDDFADAMEDRKIRPGEVVRLPSGLPREHLMELKLSQPYSQLPELESNLERHADMSVGTSNYTFGIEQVERPTATGQVKLMQEGQMPLFSKLKRFREFLAEIMYAILSRHQQMYPNGSKFWVRTPNGQLVEQVMAFPTDPLDLHVVIEIKASEAAWDKNAQKQDAVALADRMEKAYSVLSGMVMQASQPTPAAPAMLKMALGYSQVMRNLLTTFEQANIDVLIPDLQQEVLGGQILFQQIQLLAAQNAQLQAAIAGSGGLLPGAGAPGGGPEGNPGAAAGGPVPGAGGMGSPQG